MCDGLYIILLSRQEPSNLGRNVSMRILVRIERNVRIKQHIFAEQATLVQEEQGRQMRNVLYKHKGYILTTVV